MMERKSFVYGEPVSGYNFTGREEETRRLLADFQSGITITDPVFEQWIRRKMM